MVQQNADRVSPKTHGTITLEPLHPQSILRWVVRRADGDVVGEIDIAEVPVIDEYAQALALLGLTRPFRVNKALACISVRESWDEADPRGSAMLPLGSLCDVAHVHGATIPDSAGYRPAMGLRTVADIDTSKETGDVRAWTLLVYLANGLITMRDIELAIKILSRYLALPGVRAGRC